MGKPNDSSKLQAKATDKVAIKDNVIRLFEGCSCREHVIPARLVWDESDSAFCYEKKECSCDGECHNCCEDIDSEV